MLDFPCSITAELNISEEVVHQNLIYSWAQEASSKEVLTETGDCGSDPAVCLSAARGIHWHIRVWVSFSKLSDTVQVKFILEQMAAGAEKSCLHTQCTFKKHFGSLF